MSENALPKITAKLGKADAGDKIGSQSPFLSKIRSTVVENITSRSLFSLSAVPESVAIIRCQFFVTNNRFLVVKRMAL